MRLTRIYCAASLITGAALELSPAASNHLLKVLRLKAGARINIFDGQGNEFTAQLLAPQRNLATAVIGESCVSASESPLLIHLAQAISRGDKMDYTLQKAIELGVHEITPLFTQFCAVTLSPERIEKRLAHWRTIIINACEQSGRSFLPQLHQPNKLSDWLDNAPSSLGLILTPTAKHQLKDFNLAGKRITLLVGPEGGFSEEELLSAQQAGFLDWRFGPRILRTETAGVAAISALQAHWGDMG